VVDVVWTKVPEREGIGETIALRDRRRSGPDPQKEIGCASRAQFEAMCICLRHQVPMENRDHSDCPVELLPCPEHLDEQLKEMERFRTSDLATSEGDGENAMSKIMTARPRSDFVCGATETSTRSRKSRLISWLRWRRRSRVRRPFRRSGHHHGGKHLVQGISPVPYCRRSGSCKRAHARPIISWRRFTAVERR